MGERKIGVVLSGGGAKGAYEAGALNSIVEKTAEIHVMTGASIGAINAAVFAWEYQKTGDMEKAAKTVAATWSELGELFQLSFWGILWKAIVSQWQTKSPLNFASLVDNTKIKNALKGLIPEDVRISDLTRIDLAINATSLTTGKTVSFTRENDAYLLQAVLASSSIPIFFEAQSIAGAFYVDGGVFNNTPLRDALVAQATDIFVVELKPEDTQLYFETIQDSTSFHGVFKVGARLVELITDKIMYEDLKQAKRINEIIDIILALEAAGGQEKLIQKLKRSIGYHKDGKIKRHVNFYEIAPSQRLDPPGTMGFDKHDALQTIMHLGAKDAKEQLAHISLAGDQRVS